MEQIGKTTVAFIITQANCVGNRNFGLGPGKSGPECNNSAVTNASKDSIDYRDAFDMPTNVYNEHFIRAIRSSPIQREKQTHRPSDFSRPDLIANHPSTERSKQQSARLESIQV